MMYVDRGLAVKTNLNESQMNALHDLMMGDHILDSDLDSIVGVGNWWWVDSDEQDKSNNWLTVDETEERDSDAG